MRVALVNSNRIKPPIAPIGLDYLAEALSAAGHCVEVLDLCWAEDWEAAVAKFFGETSVGLVGLTLRNTDDCMCASRQSFLAEFAAIAHAIRRHTDAFVVLGGVGFSVMPEEVLHLCAADAGLWGEGEFVIVELADRMERQGEWRDLPTLIWRGDGRLHRNAPAVRPLDSLPRMSRRWVDNRRYFREGGQAGIETSRGCPSRCTYCADPVAKGRRVRVRPPQAVADELERLLEQGIDHIHTCDSEFNLPQAHATEVCREIVRRRLGDRLRWYAYCSPVPFSPELAGLMRAAGCVGINFGVDNGDAQMLARLGRDFAPEDILLASRACREAGMAVMLDLLLGSPGETEGSLRRTIALMKRARPDRVGVSLGVRVYPGTALALTVEQEGMRAGRIGGRDPTDPLFFVDPAVTPFAVDLLRGLIEDDERFFFDAAGPERNYNYSGHPRLLEAIGKGYRGAYWDILRRYG